MHWEGNSLGEIVKAPGRNKSTIFRELERNSAPEYNNTHPAEHTPGPVLYFVIEFAVLNHAILNKLIKKINQNLIK